MVETCEVLLKAWCEEDRCVVTQSVPNFDPAPESSMGLIEMVSFYFHGTYLQLEVQTTIKAQSDDD